MKKNFKETISGSEFIKMTYPDFSEQFDELRTLIHNRAGADAIGKYLREFAYDINHALVLHHGSIMFILKSDKKCDNMFFEFLGMAFSEQCGIIRKLENGEYLYSIDADKKSLEATKYLLKAAGNEYYEDYIKSKAA